ncbi:MAG: GNAT family N-acetyltransferase [Solirubrobacterales bacterium]
MDHERLQRFVEVQDEGSTYERALAELRAGRKKSHWMWFVFPQIAGLGQSEMSRRYAISSLDEARAYLDHPVLGPRLVECAQALLQHKARSAEEIMGGIDAVKLRSSMTLFARAAQIAKPREASDSDASRGLDGAGVFEQVLERYFGGEPDAATLDAFTSELHQLPCLPGGKVDAVRWEGVEAPQRAPLQGEHVLLRPVDAAADAEPFFAATHPPVAEESLWRYMFDGPYKDAEEMRRAMEWVESTDDPLFFTIVRLADQRPLGRAAYMRITPEHGVIEIGGILFAPALQRTTAATEAIYLMARHAFDELGYRRLEWKCDAENEASRRAASRFGFAYEGTFRQHMVIKGRNRDTAWFAITDGDWPRLRAAFEAWLAPENFDTQGQQKRSLEQCRGS